jgi:hypothetical protein
MKVLQQIWQITVWSRQKQDKNYQAGAGREEEGPRRDTRGQTCLESYVLYVWYNIIKWCAQSGEIAWNWQELKILERDHLILLILRTIRCIITNNTILQASCGQHHFAWAASRHQQRRYLQTKKNIRGDSGYNRKGDPCLRARKSEVVS